MTTDKQFVVTISRELGSGGRTIGRKLAERLGVRYCDKALLRGLMERFELSALRIEQLKGEKKSWFSDFVQLLSPVPKASWLMGMDARYARELQPEVSTDDIYRAECDILHALAEESSCVIAGRSAFFVLRDYPNKCDIFITASREHRLRRIMAKQDIARQDAEALLEQVDSMRE
ncbi:MAG: cytidylate kinase-like family protein, partial [Bacteroidales bacterium]|nr:cytidylate kinase-like family protein [Bacteroidales bacterium]